MLHWLDCCSVELAATWPFGIEVPCYLRTPPFFFFFSLSPGFPTVDVHLLNCRGVIYITRVGMLHPMAMLSTMDLLHLDLRVSKELFLELGLL